MPECFTTNLLKFQDNRNIVIPVERLEILYLQSWEKMKMLVKPIHRELKMQKFLRTFPN